MPLVYVWEYGVGGWLLAISTLAVSGGLKLSAHEWWTWHTLEDSVANVARLFYLLRPCSGYVLCDRGLISRISAKSKCLRPGTRLKTLTPPDLVRTIPNMRNTL